MFKRTTLTTLMSKLSVALLRRQDDMCSAAVIQALGSSNTFKRLLEQEGELIVRRDREDEASLATGVDIAIAKGILKGRPENTPVQKIDVVGRTAEEVAQDILGRLPSREGNVIILQGLSGTGKGTTVAKLQGELPRCVTWSNGNVFRSYTYLCDEILSAKGMSISEATLTPELLQTVERRVTFEKCADGSFHTLLDGKVNVCDIQNTLLKAKHISTMVPTVAQQTQGEVVRFGANAVEKLSNAGYNVILEGRAQTLDHIPTKLRFELVIHDIAVLGQRRAAQRVMAKALELVNGESNPTDKTAEKAVLAAVDQIN